MTDKARELLEQVIAEADSSHFYSSEIDKEIRAYLAEQRPEFVRLSEEEMKNCWGEPDKLNTQALINFARAIEDALEEKNK